MATFNRRDFLKIGTAVASSASVAELLTACGTAGITATVEDTGLSPNTSTPAVQTAVGVASLPPLTPTAPGKPDIAVAHGNDPEQITRGVLTALGGMERFVAKDANVLIKPNICVAYRGYEYAATTNPWVVGALVKMCIEAGARSVKVYDYPFGGTQEEAYSISGIQEQVVAAGGKMIKLAAFKFGTVRIPDGKRLKLVDVFEDVMTADTVINVPIAKVHGLSRLTLGMKNLMGVILDRPGLHAQLDENLADLASLIRPELTIVDAVRILVGNGPSGGSLDDVRLINTVIASPDIVAADSYAATMFGLHPEDLGYIVTGANRGLGRSDLQQMRIDEIQLGSS